jgi:restriction system protein
MGFWDAIAKVLADEGGPLHATVLTERLLDQGLWTSEGKTPAATVSARLYTDIKKKGAGSRFVQAGKNTFAVNPDAKSVEAPAAAPAAAPPSGSGTAPAAPGAGAPTATSAAPLKKRLSFTDATEDVLQRHGNGQPMPY